MTYITKSLEQNTNMTLIKVHVHVDVLYHKYYKVTKINKFVPIYRSFFTVPEISVLHFPRPLLFPYPGG